MESDDDYESFSFPNDNSSPSPSPSPSPKHRRLKRLKNSTVVPDQSAPIESVNELIDLPRVDFAKLEALESSNIRAFDDSSEPLSSQPESSSGFDDTLVVGDLKETEKASELEEDFGDDDGKEKELDLCYDDSYVNSDGKVRNRDWECEEGLNDDEMENKLGSGCGDMSVRTDRKTKRVLEFEDEIDGSGVDQVSEKEGDTTQMKIGEDGEKEVDKGAVNEKKGKKKRLKSSDEDPKAKTSSSNKRREEKERKTHLEQLHAESQRLLRETRGAAFKPVPIVQKPISSILEKIRQRKLEMSKKFCQPNNSESVKEYDDCLKEAVTDHSKNVETEVGDLSESVKEEKVSSVLNGEPRANDISMDGPDVCGEQKNCDNACSQTALDEKPTPVFRAPVDDTEELFGDCHTSDDSKESKDEEAGEQTISSQEEEMGPSWLTMKLKLDSAPDDISDEEENDKENTDPQVYKHAKECSSPKGDPVKAFVDDEAEEEDDSDNDRMRFGDDEEDEDDDDAEELRKMIATGYVERPIDKEARNELHQKWLEEKDEAGTDDLLRRLNVASKLREASLLDKEEGEEDVEPVDDDVEEDVERPHVARMNSKKAKEIIAQMFTDKDEDYLSSDDEETEKLLAKRCFFNKAEEKGKLVSPVEDEDSKEVFGLIKKLNAVPEVRKKAKSTSFFDTMLTGGNSNSSSKSSFLSRVSNHSLPIFSKQGSSAVRSFIFGRDDSNSRSSISVSEDTSDTISKEIQTKKVTTSKYCRSSQSEARSSGQTTKVVGESSSSLFEILKRSSSVRSNDDVVELSQSVFAAFKIPKKPVKIQGRV